LHLEPARQMVGAPEREFVVKSDLSAAGGGGYLTSISFLKEKPVQLSGLFLYLINVC